MVSKSSDSSSYMELEVLFFADDANHSSRKLLLDFIQVTLLVII